MRLIKRILNNLRIEGDLDDKDQIHQHIVKDSVFKGTNLWILFFAIIVASVGLNVNSTAVIIGAMLISPLMGPINAIGYSIATYDFQLFREALKNLIFALITGLVASSAYFALSPLATAHSELLARISPSIYDVIIALFGGFAGIIAISSRQKGNVLPGVAIATALMPPLCTAGFGIATGKFDFFLGAIYLFTINTVFIALSSALVSQWLSFPIRREIDESRKKKINLWITIVITIVLIPSVYFGYVLVQKERFSEHAQQFAASVATYEGTYLLQKQIDPAERTVHLIYGGLNLKEAQKERLKEKARIFGIAPSQVKITQGLSINYNEVDAQEIKVLELNEALKFAQNRLDSIENASQTGKLILSELNALYPEIKGVVLAASREYFSNSFKPCTMVSIEIQSDSVPENERLRIENWLAKRLNSDNLRIYYEMKPIVSAEE